jgi:hypothetical protein
VLLLAAERLNVLGDVLLLALLHGVLRVVRLERVHQTRQQLLQPVLTRGEPQHDVRASLDAALADENTV